MKEVKFRVWDKNVPTEKEAQENLPPTGMMINWDYVRQSDYLLDGIDGKYPLMQYTTLKDNKKVDIYEGDILAVKFSPHWVERISWDGDPDAICEIYWDLNSFGMRAKGNSDFRYPDLCHMNFDHVEVIGNIYDNPNLLGITPSEYIAIISTPPTLTLNKK